MNFICFSGVERILVIMRKVIIFIFPSVVMFIVTRVSFTNMNNFEFVDFKGVYMISLILVFPTLFLYQGVLCAKKKCNLMLSLVISSVTYLMIMNIYLNGSASFYLLTYILAGVFGHLFTCFKIESE